MKYTIAIAGSTKKTEQCAFSLLKSEQFQINWILTPTAKPTGRKKIISANPMENFAKRNNIKSILVESKINESIKSRIKNIDEPDFLLVVDFGYIIPDWLLKTPKIASLNIHPSELPKWRGSSPGQFAILFNEKKSAVTLMVMDNKLDHGPIINQDFFTVKQSWNQNDYYQHAFDLVCQNLDKKIIKFAQNPIDIKKQPEKSPTITAKSIDKSQAFVPWNHVKMAMKGLCPTDLSPLSEMLQLAYKKNGQFALTLERASKAFDPWPHLWTKIPTNKGEKRMKIIETELENSPTNSIEKKLKLKTVHIEGKNPGRWIDVKNIVQD